MIAHISGIFFEKEVGHAIVTLNNGLGYKVHMPQRIIEKYKKNQEISLYTFHRVKEDQNDLYGFESKEEQFFFEKLISVSGVGPKTALLILEFSPSTIRKAIEDEDIKFLSQAKGMGKKTVSRLILELKGKLPDILGEEENPEISGETTLSGVFSQKFLDCQTTLESLGFNKKSITELFQNSQKFLEEKSEEEIIKFGLQEL